jgi:hypothetical protein
MEMKEHAFLLAGAIAVLPALGCTTTDEVEIKGLLYKTAEDPAMGAFEIQGHVHMDSDESLRIRIDGEYLVFESSTGLAYYELWGADGTFGSPNDLGSNGILGIEIEPGVHVIELVDDAGEVLLETDPIAVYEMGSDPSLDENGDGFKWSTVFVWGTPSNLHHFATGRLADTDSETIEYALYNARALAAELEECTPNPSAPSTCVSIGQVAPGASVTATMARAGDVYLSMAYADGSVGAAHTDLQTPAMAAFDCEVYGGTKTLESNY